MFMVEGIMLITILVAHYGKDERSQALSPGEIRQDMQGRIYYVDHNSSL